MVSVIIPAYNSAKTIERAIQSVLCQTYHPLEIIVVDDGSTDNTAKILESFGAAIRVVRQENQGRSAARNLGMTLATGKYLAFLDADDWWDHGKLEQQAFILEQHPDTALVHCGYFVVQPNGEIDPFPIRQRGEVDNSGSTLFEQLVFRNIIGSPSFVLLRSQVAQQLGGFNESLNGTEDWDLWLRIAVTHKIGYIASPLTYYQLHENTGIERVLARNVIGDWPQIINRLFQDEKVLNKYTYLEYPAKAQVWLRTVLLDCVSDDCLSNRGKLSNIQQLKEFFSFVTVDMLKEWTLEYARLQVEDATRIKLGLHYIDRIHSTFLDFFQTKKLFNKRHIKRELCISEFLKAHKHSNRKGVRKLGWYVVFYDQKWLVSKYFLSIWLSSIAQI